MPRKKTTRPDRDLNFLSIMVLILRNTAKMLRLLYLSAVRYFSARGLDHAASLSFYFLLSLAPFMVLLVSAMGYVATVLGPSAAPVDDATRWITLNLQRFFPVESDTVSEIVSGLIARRSSFGLVGGVVMLFGASMVFGAIEHALRDVFGIVERRRFLVSRAVFSILLAATGLVILITLNVVTIVESYLAAWPGHTLTDWLRSVTLLDHVLKWLPIPIGFLAVLYAPGVVKVRFGHALAGAGLFFALWEAVRLAYGAYVTSVARFGVLYGSFATPVLLILWVFYTANVLLFCLSFVAVLGDRPKQDLAK